MASSREFEITRPDLEQFDLPDKAFITDVEPIASYSWIEASRPTIAIPGIPPLWSPAREPKRLEKDSGLVYIAQNAARHPDSPLEPLFRAIYVEQPQFDISTIDIVSDRNNFRKLLTFVDPTGAKFGAEAFTIRAESVGKTVIFCRDESLVQEFIGPNEFKGYGHVFEKAYTTNEIPESTGHHRVLKYRFGEMNMLIRHETDGYVDDKKLKQISDHEYTDDIIAGMLNSLTIGPSKVSSASTSQTSKLQIKEIGHKVPLASTLEIKTRTAYKPLTLDEVATQLWISQTPKLVRAYHKKGVFDVPVLKDVSVEVKQWEEENQKNLRIFAGLLIEIVGLTRVYGHAIIKYNVALDKLTITKSSLADMLPTDLYRKWDAKVDQKSEATVKRQMDLSNVDALPIDDTVIDRVDVDKQQVERKSNAGGDLTTIQVGSTSHDLPLDKIPYLYSYVAAVRKEKGIDAEIKHEPIPFFSVAVAGIRSGYRECFCLLNSDVNSWEALCTTYDMLKVDVLDEQSLEDLSENIKAHGYDLKLKVKGDQALAQDSAFRLVYHMINYSDGSSPEDCNKIYDCMSYISSHPWVFDDEIRCVVRAVYDKYFKPTARQIEMLNSFKEHGGKSQDDRGNDGDSNSDDELYESS